MSQTEEQSVLTLTDDGIEVPEGVDLSEGVVFRARGATVDHNPGSPDYEVYPAVDERHLEEEQEHGATNEQLDAYEVSIKPYGEEAETYSVEVAMADGGQRTVQVGQVKVTIAPGDTVLDLFDRLSRDGDTISTTVENTVLCRPFSGENRASPPTERISADLEEVEDGDKLELYRLPVSERPAYPELVITDGGHRQPPEADSHSPPPEVKTVETRSNVPGEPTQVDVSVKYWTHRGAGEPLNTTVSYRTRSDPAEIRAVEGDGRLPDQLTAIAVAEDTVVNVPGVDDVRTVEEELEKVVEYIGRCRGAADE